MPPIITNVDQKLLRSTKFPPEFNRKVDTSKINVSVIKRSMTSKHNLNRDSS